MSKVLNNNNDDAVMPETSYEVVPEPASSGYKSKSIWMMSILAILMIAVGVFVGLRRGSHTDPAPYGGPGTNGAVQQEHTEQQMTEGETRRAFKTGNDRRERETRYRRFATSSADGKPRPA